MRVIHQGLPIRDFVRPATGIVDVTVCVKSGLLKTASCNQGVTLPFLTGTQPAEYCDIHGKNVRVVIDPMRDPTMGINDTVLLGQLKMPTLPDDLFPDMAGSQRQNNQTNRPANNRRPNQQPTNPNQGRPGLNNPYLDDDMPVSPEQESRIGTNNGPEYFRGPQNTPANNNTNSQTRPQSGTSAGTASQESGEYPYDLEIPYYDPLLD
jgi:penicillin-binding protein 1A